MATINRNRRLLYLYVKGIQVTLQTIRQILEILNEIPAITWWGQMVGVPSSAREKAMIFIFGKQQLEPRERKDIIQKIGETYISTIASDAKFKEYFEKTSLNAIRQSVSPDSSLFKFFERRGKERPVEADSWAFSCFFVWFKIQEHIFNYIVDEKGEEASFWTSVNSSCDVTATNVEEVAPKVSTFKNDHAEWIQNKFDIIDSMTPFMNDKEVAVTNRLSALHESTDVEQLLDDADDLFARKLSFATRVFSDNYEILFKMSAKLLNDLFILLNTCFLTESKKKEIVQILRNSAINNNIQVAYNYFKEDFPEYARAYEFAESIHRTINSNEVDWRSAKDSGCFHIGWNTYQVTHLYNLLKNEYISGSTDIRDFFHALTGTKLIEERNFKKINYVGKEKQGLALIIGKLIQINNDSKINWNNYPKIFLYKGREPNFHSSTPYHQAERKEEYKELVNAILETENIKPKIQDVL